MTVSALELRKACTSVFAAINSTPETPSSIMRLMALPPPPPTPMTLITAPVVKSVSNENSMIYISPFLLSELK